jgi:uncharacterized damage-inducible protein DinB
MTTTLFIQAYSEARTRLTTLLEIITEIDLAKKLHPAPNSVGFLMRHIGDVELLFAKNVFHGSNIHVVAKTLIDAEDTGVWTNLDEIKTYLHEAYHSLVEVLKIQTDDSWSDLITTKEFGTKTKAEAFGRIISHTAYHAGQIALILKYGK